MKIIRYIFSRKFIDKVFEITVIIKAIFGFFEVLGGILFSFSSRIIADNFIISLAQHEIADDPNDRDIISNYLVNTANSLYQDSRIFAVAYLFFHGMVNILLVIFLAKGKVRNYPIIIGFLNIFIIYQVYKYFHTYSLSLLSLTAFDIFFVLVVYLEYKRHTRRKKVEEKH